MMEIMIVEDEIVPANYLKRILEAEGYSIVGMTGKGSKAIELAKKSKPDLILMDIMLKDHISGAEAAKEIHYRNPEIMIVFLTAYSDKEMVAFAIESNAFSYLLKPYREQEILAVMELARAKVDSRKEYFSQNMEKNREQIELCGGYVYDMQFKRLFLDEKEVYLGQRALKLLQFLCMNRHITMEIEVILNEVWDTRTSGQTLRSLIHRIREATHTDLIKNVNKFGYRICLKEEG